MVSIHLILLFIRFGKVPVIVTQMFQYISCYSLSNYTENIMEDKASFNTSHVTLYLRELGIAF